MHSKNGWIKSDPTFSQKNLLVHPLSCRSCLYTHPSEEGRKKEGGGGIGIILTITAMREGMPGKKKGGGGRMQFCHPTYFTTRVCTPGPLASTQIHTHTHKDKHTRLVWTEKNIHIVCTRSLTPFAYMHTHRIGVMTRPAKCFLNSSQGSNEATSGSSRGRSSRHASCKN